MLSGITSPTPPSPRPPSKPPFSEEEIFPEVDAVPIADLTLMRAPPWRVQLEEKAHGGESFRDRFPEESRRILEGIEHGVSVDYVGDRTVDRFGHNLPIDVEDVTKVSAVIADDVRNGKKAGPFARKPFLAMCISPIGCVPKKNSGKVRVIHHLSYPHGGDSVNAAIVEEPLRLPTFGHAARTVVQFGEGALLIKLDVSAAYKQVPVRREDWPLLGFLWEKQYYYERVLPFGLRSSCRLWDLYAAALHYFLYHQLGTQCRRQVIHYVDDFLFIVEPGKMKEARGMLARAQEMCARLGLPLADEKTEGPCTMLTFLGIELDSVKLQARLPAQRFAELQQLMVEWGKRTQASVRDLQRLAGLLNFACQVVRPGRFYLAGIFSRISRLLVEGCQPNRQFPITRAVSADLIWWQEFLPRWNGVSLLYEADWRDATTIELFTDACEDGFGGHFKERWFAGRWSPAVWGEAMHGRAKRSMPFLELYALVVAALIWGKEWKGMKITFRCDCEPVVKAIEKCRSPRRGMMHLLRILCQTACLSGFDFRAVWILGTDNVAADALSRYGFSQTFKAACPNATRETRCAIPSVSLPLPLAEVSLPPPIRSVEPPLALSLA